MKYLVLALIIVSNSFAELCEWVSNPSQCMTNYYIRFTGSAAQAITTYQAQCRSIWKTEIAADQVTVAGANCPLHGITGVTTALRITQSVPDYRDTVFVTVNNYWSSTVAGSSGSTEAITDLERLESFRGGLSLVLYTFLAAAPIGLMVLLLRRSV